MLTMAAGNMAEDKWKRLTSIKWCTAQAPGPGKPHDPSLFAAEDRFYAPREIRPSEDALSISGACALLDGHGSEALKGKLGWHKPPSVQLLKAQILWLHDEVIPSPSQKSEEAFWRLIMMSSFALRGSHGARDQQQALPLWAGSIDQSF